MWAAKQLVIGASFAAMAATAGAQTGNSIHNKQRRADGRERAVCVGVIGYLIAHTGLQGVGAAIFEFGGELAGHAKQEMPFVTPMIGKVAGRVVDHAHTHVAELLRAPEGFAGCARIFCALDF